MKTNIISEFLGDEKVIKNMVFFKFIVNAIFLNMLGFLHRSVNYYPL